MRVLIVEDDAALGLFLQKGLKLEGHQVSWVGDGEAALVHAAEVLEKTFRDSDVIARFGGDEFAVLALEVSGHSESTIRARLKQNLEELNAKRSRCTLSISLGAVRFDPTNPRSPASIEQLMIRADEAMYEEKRLRSKPFLVTRAD